MDEARGALFGALYPPPTPHPGGVNRSAARATDCVEFVPS
jgi:hypothetical protein